MAKLEIFKAGLQTASSGERIKFSAADIAAIASGYDPALHEAPAVVGHPRDDDPAYGWVKALSADGDSLYAELDKVDPAFAELVNAGRFRKLSSAFYRPSDPGNPKPGQWYLRHLGFLGAIAPAVKGLKPAHFAGANERFVAFGEIPSTAVVRLFRRMRDWIVSSAGVDTAEQILPADELDSLGHLAAQPDTDDPSPSYREHNDMTTPTAAELAEKERKLNEREAALNAQGAQFSERDRALARAEDERLLDAMIKAGRLVPSFKPALLAFMESLAAEQKPLEFSEGANKITVGRAEWFRKFLDLAGKVVTFGEVAPTEEHGELGATRFTFAPGAKVDRARLELHDKALAYQDAHKGISFEAACKAVGVN